MKSNSYEFSIEKVFINAWLFKVCRLTLEILAQISRLGQKGWTDLYEYTWDGKYPQVKETDIETHSARFHIVEILLIKRLIINRQVYKF